VIGELALPAFVAGRPSVPGLIALLVLLAAGGSRSQYQYRAEGLLVFVRRAHSSSNPKGSKPSARAFSETVRTTSSGTPSGTSAWISILTSTLEPVSFVRCCTISCRGHGQAPRAIRPLQDVDVSEGQIRDTIINHSVEV